VKNPIDVVNTGVNLDFGQKLIAAAVAVTALQKHTSHARHSLEVNGHPAACLRL